MLTSVRAVPLRVWGIVALVVALTGTSVWQAMARKDADVRAANAERDLEAFKGAYNTLAATCAEQGRAVRQMAAENEKRRRATERELVRARADAKQWRHSSDRLRAILAAPMSLTCDEAVEAAKDAL